MDAWYDIRTQAEAGAFMERVMRFHDGCLREAHAWTEEQWVGHDLAMHFGRERQSRVRLLLQRQWAPLSAVELLFDEVTRFNLAPARADEDGIIQASTLRVDGGEIIWAGAEPWEPGGPRRDEVTWVSGGRLRWRDASAWMGSALHYGPRADRPPAP